ncbi:hypothetical protein [Telluribacter humicola]|uniref:hypothetical protein n=1 Tax=Telluribacter humicola TaxID=1720261 RepID=UPI001A95ED5C|nr:hypothetical protein [Telluribacter humicola]
MKNSKRVELAEFADLATGISRFREAPRAMLLSRAPTLISIHPTIFPESLRPEWELILGKLTQQEARFSTFEDRMLDKMVHSILTMSDLECRMIVKQILDVYEHLQERKLLPVMFTIRRRRYSFIKMD